MKELTELPQIIGTRSDEVFFLAAEIFESMGVKALRTTPEEAELAKLFTNTWRYIKFAAANQFWMMANDAGVSFENVRDSIRTVSSANSNQYKQALEPVINEVVNTTKIKPRLVNKLNEFNIKVTPEGLDFSNSKFRTVPQAQTKISQAFQEVANIGDNATLGSVDTTRQALRELKLVGDDSSARSANALIDEAISAVRDSGKQVKGYNKMLSDFAENAEFLDEINRSLSAGDRQTVDTAYRKLATSLKTNNERRMKLIQDLDTAIQTMLYWLGL
jgi:uncharacterized protein YdbL (DUF1318 family)